MAALVDVDVPTDFGCVRVHQAASFYFIQRHHADAKDANKYIAPHLINHCAIAQAFARLSVTHVVGIASVGSMRAEWRPGTIVVPDDYFNIFNVVSAFEDTRGHISPSYNEQQRQLVISVVKQLQGLTLHSTGVYVQSRGPRFESPAEIAFLSGCGDVIGMTGANEATTMKERQIAYASLCIIDNYANGIAGAQIDLTSFRDLVAKNENTVHTLLRRLIMAMESRVADTRGDEIKTH